MAKVKTYYDEIKGDECFFSGGRQGWEVHFRFEDVWIGTYPNQKKAKRLRPCWPFSAGDGVPASEKKLCRQEVLFGKKLRDTLAKASRNREEYSDLNARLCRVKQEELEALLAKGIKGFELGRYIRENYLTHSEAHWLFYRA